MASVERSTTRSRSWSAWAGSREELLKIGAELEKLYEQRRQAILAEYDRETDRIVKECLDSEDEILAQVRNERRQGDRVNYESRWQFTVTLSDGPEEVTGPVREVFQEFDRRTHTKVTFSGAAGPVDKERDRVKVEFEKAHPEAVFLHVRSTDPGWARQVMSKMSDEIGMGSPWWAFLYTPLGRSLYRGISWSVIYFSLYSLFSPIFPSKEDPAFNQVVGIVALLLGALLLAWAVNNRRSLNWMLPSFEVTDGGQPTGTRFLLYIAGLALAFAAGIIVNRIS
ncbi:hypothetical protein [Micromonospora avicenniae]|uniref:Uncharacterized protein n=1 Tax=Micromonospora avicenniae TaxID=1198245 RepID=A0A1N7FTC0_9ACTN|nr:hypothetical protein [Micromonospora avicenniae]SIS03612.1 hypothetical protein SAMN05444858_1487 [Micromonospora avicenniae]